MAKHFLALCWPCVLPPSLSVWFISRSFLLGSGMAPSLHAGWRERPPGGFSPSCQSICGPQTPASPSASPSCPRYLDRQKTQVSPFTKLLHPPKRHKLSLFLSRLLICHPAVVHPKNHRRGRYSGLLSFWHIFISQRPGDRRHSHGRLLCGVWPCPEKTGLCTQQLCRWGFIQNGIFKLQQF